MLPDHETVTAALRLAVRAPSIHNSQPWRWKIGDDSIQLYADPSRLLAHTDALGREMVMSCGAAVHHLRVALATLGWSAEVHRLPNPADPDHLAAVVPHRKSTIDPADVRLAGAISRRRTDRRAFSSWPVPAEFYPLLADRAQAEGALLDPVHDVQSRYDLADAMARAALRQAALPGYDLEIALWTGRHAGTDGVPAANATPAQRYGDLTMREFPGGELDQPEGAREDGGIADLLILHTPSDDRMAWLRAGEATSAVLLTITEIGLAATPLSQPLEIDELRHLIRQRVIPSNTFPQLVIRVGWAPVTAAPLPESPRRPLAEVVERLSPIT